MEVAEEGFCEDECKIWWLVLNRCVCCEVFGAVYWQYRYRLCDACVHPEEWKMLLRVLFHCLRTGHECNGNPATAAGGGDGGGGCRCDRRRTMKTKRGQRDCPFGVPNEEA